MHGDSEESKSTTPIGKGCTMSVCLNIIYYMEQYAADLVYNLSIPNVLPRGDLVYAMLS